MKNTLGFCAALAAALMAAPASAALVTSVTANSTTGISGLTSWPAPFNVASVANPSLFPSAEGNYGGASLYSLAQSWTATSTGKVSNFQIAISGTAPVTFDVALYNAQSFNTSEITSGTYTPGGNVSANLLSGGAAQTWSGYTLQNSTAAVLNFALTGADAVNVTSGQQYIFEISSTVNPTGMVWFRGGASPVYTGGAAFRQRTPLNGAVRDMSLAVTIVPVPEPTSVALAGFGALGLGLLRRRK